MLRSMPSATRRHSATPEGMSSKLMARNRLGKASGKSSRVCSAVYSKIWTGKANPQFWTNLSGDIPTEGRPQEGRPSDEFDVGWIAGIMQLLEPGAGQDVSRFGKASRCSPGAAGAAASVHVVDEHCSEIDQHLPPGDDVDPISHLPIAGLVCSTIAPAQSFQALIGVPAGVQVDVLVHRVLAVAIDRTCADEVARRCSG